MPKNRDLTTLLDIRRAAQRVVQFKQGLSQEKFLADAKTQAATLFQLLVIGEATKRLSPSLRQRHDNVPWSLMAGMRDNLIHEYDDIDMGEVWKTSEMDIPALLPLLDTIIGSIEGQSD